MAYKFVNADQLDADMAAVANAIRSKGGTSDKLAFPNGMISAISNISTGVELDFEIVAYASEEALLAAVPAENTIGVITTTDISGWAMGDYPDPSWEMPEGFLYINIKASSYNSSDLDFGLLKKGNEICIAPISAKQYVSGTYVDVTCKSYQNGAWEDWWNGEIYDSGVFYIGHSNSVSNGTVTYEAEHILFATTASSVAEVYEMFGPFDLARFNNISAIFTNATSNINATACIFVSPNTGANRSSATAIIETDMAKDTRNLEVSLDVSSILDTCYVYVGTNTVGSKWTNARNVYVTHIEAEV